MDIKYTHISANSQKKETEAKCKLFLKGSELSYFSEIDGFVMTLHISEAVFIILSKERTNVSVTQMRQNRTVRPVFQENI